MKLKDICEINPRTLNIGDDTEVSFIPMSSVSEDGKIDTSDIRTYADVKKGYTTFKENDVLFAKITPCMENGKGAVACGLKNGYGCGSSEFHVLRATELVIPEWLYYLTARDSFRKEAEKHMTGSAGQRRVPRQYLENYTVNIPSLSKQEQQVQILSRLKLAIDHRKEQLKAFDDLIKARFVELFGDLMENPLGWPIMTIADVSTFLKSGLSRKLSDDDIGLPVIRSGNIQDGQFIFDDVKYWYVDDPQGANTKDYILNDGDVLVNFINSASQIGKTAIYRDTGRNCIYTTNIFRMKLADNCDEYYYNWFAMSDYYYRHLQNIIQPAVNQASFTTVNFLKLPIPLPTKEKQREFADFVKQVDKSKFAGKRTR